MILVKDLIEKFQQALKEEWGYIWGTVGIVWDAARQNQKVQYMVNKYGSRWKGDVLAKQDNYYYAALYGSKWIGHRVADCSGLFRWAFGELGGSIAHGSNSIWKGYCSAKGTLSGGKRTDGKELRPGTAIFTDKAGDKTHIGLYIGDGTVIEASGTQTGVIASKVTLSKWKCWGELKDVRYERETGSAGGGNAAGDAISGGMASASRPTLRRGMKGTAVKQLQERLKSLGYDLGAYGVDGDFGKMTEAAVRAFQQDRGLTVDGVVGAKTWAELEKDGGNAPVSQPVREKTYNVKIMGLDLTQATALVRNYPTNSVMAVDE